MAASDSLHAEVEFLRQRLDFAKHREALLARIDAATRREADPASVALTAATLLGRDLRANRCLCAMIDEDQKVFNVVGDYVDGVDSMIGAYSFDSFSPRTAEVLRSGLLLSIDDTETDPRCAAGLESYRAAGIAASLVVPLMRQGRLSALMAVHSCHPRQWTPDEIDITVTVADRLWETFERAHILRDLRLSEERLRLAHQAGNSGAFEHLLSEDRILLTPELCRLYGLPATNLVGCFADWIKRVHPDDFARIQPIREAALASGSREVHYDFRALRPDGSERWLHCQASIFYSPEGKPQRMIGINIDIHDRRLAEAGLARTEKLAAVGRLASTIAHEINNPLEAVTNLIFLARHSEDLTELRSLLLTADDELRRMTAITSQILRFHRQSKHPGQADAQDLFSSTLGIYAARLAREDIRVEERIRTAAPVVCLEGEIRQVLSNLIDNALDAMPPGGRLLLRARKNVHGIVLTVADTGHGISPRHLPRIFEPFFTTKGNNGTGLGLWVSQDIICRHGGSIRVRSRATLFDHGAVFTIFLPFESPLLPPRKPPVPGTTSPTQASPGPGVVS